MHNNPKLFQTLSVVPNNDNKRDFSNLFLLIFCQHMHAKIMQFNSSLYILFSGLFFSTCSRVHTLYSYSPLRSFFLFSFFYSHLAVFSLIRVYIIHSFIFIHSFLHSMFYFLSIHSFNRQRSFVRSFFPFFRPYVQQTLSWYMLFSGILEKERVQKERTNELEKTTQK